MSPIYFPVREHGPGTNDSEIADPLSLYLVAHTNVFFTNHEMANVMKPFRYTNRL